jgi:hypothetical protein
MRKTTFLDAVSMEDSLQLPKMCFAGDHANVVPQIRRTT